MYRLTQFILAGLATVLTATSASAQQLPRRYQPVDQYVADRNSLSTSLRQLQAGLNRPIGFQDVYEVPGEPGKLMRVHGGLQAVFSQSLYGADGDGPMALIPPNTVFRIGPRVLPAMPGELTASGDVLWQAEPRQSSDRVLAEGYGPQAVAPTRSPRARSSAPGALSRVANVSQRSEPSPQPALDEPGTMFGDEQYRRERLLELMRRAAAAE